MSKRKSGNFVKNRGRRTNSASKSGGGNSAAGHNASVISVESAIGAASMLAANCAKYKYLFACDFEWMIVPPISLQQFRIFRDERNHSPFAYVSWAKVSDEVEAKLLDGAAKLAPEDWNSGDKIYIIDMIDPFGGEKQILNYLAEHDFKDVDAKIVRRKDGGNGKDHGDNKNAGKEMFEAVDVRNLI